MNDGLNFCRRHLIAVAGFSALINLLYVAPTIYMLQVYDRVVPTGGKLTLLFLTSILLFALATLSLLDRIRSKLLTRAGVVLDLALASTILESTIGRPNASGARAALREFDIMRQTITGPGILALFDAFWTPIYVLVCFLVHPLIGLVALSGTALLPVIAWLNARATRERLEQAQAAANSSYAHQEAILQSAEVVRALGMKQAMIYRQLRQRETMMTLQTQAGFAGGGYVTLTKFVRLALQSLALGLGALLAIENAISPGAIFASTFLIARALSPIEQLVGSWRGIVQARASQKNLDRLLNAPANARMPTQLPVPRGVLRLEQVVIMNAARDNAILSGVSFHLDAGQVLAIVGPSGAGKSTLVRAIAGAIAPDRGEIRLDGADQSDWDSQLLAQHIGYLPQDSSLFAGTIKENICRFATELGGDMTMIDAAVVTAAQKVGAHDLILRLPDGYDHRLQTGGRGLSAGQAQRVALARAAFADPVLMILDEPNAHLDAEGDVQLVNAIGRMKAAGSTVIVVSHKLSILPVVDRMMVLRDGRIEIYGPRDEVLPKLTPPNLNAPSRANKPQVKPS